MIQKICYNLLLVTNKLCAYIKVWSGKVFGNKPSTLLTNKIENIYWWNEYIRCYVLNTKIEPFDNYWISTWHIMKNMYGPSICLTKDTYIYPLKNSSVAQENIGEIMNSYYKNTYNNCLNQLYESPDIHEFLIIMKTNTVKNVVVCSMKNKDNLISGVSREFSDVRFLTIQYTHPRMEYVINIKLPNEYFISNNEILSCTFVKMWLEHQTVKYEYDMDYVLKIIDYNINLTDLKSNQSIVIYKNEYIVIDNNEYTLYSNFYNNRDTR